MDTILVKATWDPEALVWVATSDDVPGLITEASTAEELERKHCVMIPELLIENGLIESCAPSGIPFSLLAEKQFLAQGC